VDEPVLNQKIKRMPKKTPKSKVEDKASKERGLLLLELAEIKEISDKIFERIEKKIEVLRALEASVDEKIMALKRLGQEKDSPLTTSETIDHKQAILALQQKGLKNEEIAGILNLPVGEVELILNLNKDLESFQDDTPKAHRELKSSFKKLLKHKRRFGIIPWKILGSISLLIGIVVIYSYFIQRNNTPSIPQNIEQNLTLQQPKSPEVEKSKAIDLIRQKYSAPSKTQMGDQDITVGQTEHLKGEVPKVQAIEQKDQKKTIKVTATSATVRSKPSLDSQPVTWVTKGIVFEIREELTDGNGKKWYKIKTSDGREGWIADKVVIQSS
jgi:cytoskeletal protein RodZ